MNFQDLKSVETSKFYLDVAIRRTKKRIDLLRQQRRKGTLLQKSKKLELSKLESVDFELRDLLFPILKSYPSFDNLSEFYKELIKTTIDLPYMKKSLAAIKWCVEKNAHFMRLYKNKIRRSTEITRINQYRREYYGRISSTMRQIDKHLIYLEEARKIMKGYPAIKTSLPTVAITGFPNVGKSTLLTKITTAKPKIAEYAFTTQRINQGFATINGEKIQFLDTPGTLDRFEKQNVIEKMASLAIKYLAEVIIYVFDPTETYEVKMQIELLRNLKKSRKPIIIYLSKTDVADKEVVKEFKKKYPDIITTPSALKKKLETIEFL